MGRAGGEGCVRPVALGELGDGKVRDRRDLPGSVREEHLQPLACQALPDQAIRLVHLIFFAGYVSLILLQYERLCLVHLYVIEPFAYSSFCSLFRRRRRCLAGIWPKPGAGVVSTDLVVCYDEGPLTALDKFY